MLSSTIFSVLYLLVLSVESRVVDVKNKRTSCNIFDHDTEQVSSRFCDTLPENINTESKDDEGKTEFFCHTVWSNTSDPSSEQGFNIKVLRQQCINNLGDAHSSCRDKVNTSF